MNAPTISKLMSEMKDLEILLLSNLGFNFRKVRVVPEVASIQIIEFDVITNANRDRFVSPKLLLYASAKANANKVVSARVRK
jgi:hypothetical protein